MKRHSIIARLNPADTKKITINDKYSQVTELRFVDGQRYVGHGIGQMLVQLAKLGMYPSENAIDLTILAATVTAADTRISRTTDAQDSWTREIDLYVPVLEPEIWSANDGLIERILQFLTGDIWRVTFRKRQKGMDTLIDRLPMLFGATFDSVSLLSGGLDSFAGAIDLLETGKNPLFVSHYRDASTKSQVVCADRIGKVYGDLMHRYVRANVSFDKNDMADMGTETTTRGRSFIFFALACLAASALDGATPIYVPENGLISLNIPLDPLRLGAWSTRTTHPFYMKRWQNLVDNLGLGAKLLNPYRFKTKGELLAECKNKPFLQKNLDVTISCSSVSKARFNKDKTKRVPGHCGYCTPCLIRRASIQAAFGNDPTKYSIRSLDAQALNSKQAESTDVRAFQVMSRRLSKKHELAKILVHKTGPLSDYSKNEIADYAAVFHRGIAEVGAIVDDVLIEVA